VDYAGSSPQIERGLNSVMNFTWAFTVYPIKCALDPFTRRNEGSFRSVTVDAPLGSILNPRFPAPCNARQLTAHLLAGVVHAALAKAIPDKVTAEAGAPATRPIFSGVDRAGNRFTQILFASGGMGASANQDGYSCTAFPTNSGAGSIEVFEENAPLIVWAKEFRQDSGGPGKHRGGLGQDVIIEVVSNQDIYISLLSDRQKYPPHGIFGGMDGAPVEIKLADGRPIHPKSRTPLKPGDRLILRYAGGGGYGNPRSRDPSAVHRDVQYGYVSKADAAEVYGTKLPESFS
jgi:N-methylhydantoinase B